MEKTKKRRMRHRLSLLLLAVLSCLVFASCAVAMGGNQPPIESGTGATEGISRTADTYSGGNVTTSQVQVTSSSLPHILGLISTGPTLNTWLFSYNGTPSSGATPGVSSRQIFTSEHGGKYLLEVWGAQGGSGYVTSGPGPYGAYARGVVDLAAGQTIYIYVGGGGAYGTYSGGGGGASDIRTSGATADTQASLESRLVTAGGGGGLAEGGSNIGGANFGYGGGTGAWNTSGSYAGGGSGGVGGGRGAADGKAGSSTAGGGAGGTSSTSANTAGGGGGGITGGGGGGGGYNGIGGTGAGVGGAGGGAYTNSYSGNNGTMIAGGAGGAGGTAAGGGGGGFGGGGGGGRGTGTASGAGGKSGVAVVGANIAGGWNGGGGAQDDSGAGGGGGWYGGGGGGGNPVGNTQGGGGGGSSKVANHLTYATTVAGSNQQPVPNLLLNNTLQIGNGNASNPGIGKNGSARITAIVNPPEQATIPTFSAERGANYTALNVSGKTIPALNVNDPNTATSSVSYVNFSYPNGIYTAKDLSKSASSYLSWDGTNISLYNIKPKTIFANKPFYALVQNNFGVQTWVQFNLTYINY